MSDLDTRNQFRSATRVLTVGRRLDPVAWAFSIVAALCIAVAGLIAVKTLILVGVTDDLPVVSLPDRRILADSDRDGGCFQDMTFERETGRFLVSRSAAGTCGQDAASPQLSAKLYGFDPENRMWRTEGQPLGGEAAAFGLSSDCEVGDRVGCGGDGAVWSLGTRGGLARRGAGDDNWTTWLSQSAFEDPATGIGIDGNALSAISFAPEGFRFVAATRDGVLAIGNAETGEWGASIRQEGTGAVRDVIWNKSGIWLGASRGVFFAPVERDGTIEKPLEPVVEGRVLDLEPLENGILTLLRVACEVRGPQTMNTGCPKALILNEGAPARTVMDGTRAPSGLSLDRIDRIAASGDLLIFAHDRGMTAYDTVLRRWLPLRDRAVTAMETAPDGTIWAGGEGWAGALRPEGEALEIVDLPGAPKGETIASITFDDQNRPVLSARAGAGYRINGAKAELLYRSSAMPLGEPIRRVLSDGRRILYVGDLSAVLHDTLTRRYDRIALDGHLASLRSGGDGIASDGSRFAVTRQGAVSVFALNDLVAARVLASPAPRDVFSAGPDRVLVRSRGGSIAMHDLADPTKSASVLVGSASGPLDTAALRDATVDGTRIVFASDRGIDTYDVSARRWRSVLSAQDIRTVEAVLDGEEMALATTGEGRILGVNLATGTRKILNPGGLLISDDAVADARMASENVLALLGEDAKGTLLLQTYDVREHGVAKTITLPNDHPRHILPAPVSKKDGSVHVRSGSRLYADGRPVYDAAPSATLLDAWKGPQFLWTFEADAFDRRYLTRMAPDGSSPSCLLRQIDPPPGLEDAVPLGDRFVAALGELGPAIFDRSTLRWRHFAVPAKANRIAAREGTLYIEGIADDGDAFIARIPAASFEGMDSCAEPDSVAGIDAAVLRAGSVAASPTHGNLLGLAPDGAVSILRASRRSTDALAPAPPLLPDAGKVRDAIIFGDDLVLAYDDRIALYDPAAHGWTFEAVPPASQAERFVLSRRGDVLSFERRGSARASGMVLSIGEEIAASRPYAVAAPLLPPGSIEGQLRDAMAVESAWLFLRDGGIEAFDPRSGQWIEHIPLQFEAAGSARLFDYDGVPLLRDRKRLHWIGVANGRIVMQSVSEAPILDIRANGQGRIVLLEGSGRVVQCARHETASRSCTQLRPPFIAWSRKALLGAIPRGSAWIVEHEGGFASIDAARNTVPLAERGASIRTLGDDLLVILDGSRLVLIDDKGAAARLDFRLQIQAIGTGADDVPWVRLADGTLRQRGNDGRWTVPASPSDPVAVNPAQGVFLREDGSVAGPQGDILPPGAVEADGAIRAVGTLADGTVWLQRPASVLVMRSDPDGADAEPMLDVKAAFGTSLGAPAARILSLTRSGEVYRATLEDGRVFVLLPDAPPETADAKADPYAVVYDSRNLAAFVKTLVDRGDGMLSPRKALSLGPEGIVVSTAGAIALDTGPLRPLEAALSDPELETAWFRWDRGTRRFRFGEGDDAPDLPASAFMPPADPGAMGRPLRTGTLPTGRTVAVYRGGIAMWKDARPGLSGSQAPLHFRPARIASDAPLILPDGVLDGDRVVSFDGRSRSATGADRTATLAIAPATVVVDRQRGGARATSPETGSRSLLDDRGFAWDRRSRIGWAEGEAVAETRYGVHALLDATRAVDPGRVAWAGSGMALLRARDRSDTATIAAMADQEDAPDLGEALAALSARLRIASAVPIADEDVLLATDAGLFALSPGLPSTRLAREGATVERLAHVRDAAGARVVVFRRGTALERLDAGHYARRDGDPFAERIVFRIGDIAGTREGDGIRLSIGAIDLGTGRQIERPLTWRSGTLELLSPERIRFVGSGLGAMAVAGGMVPLDGARLPPLDALRLYAYPGFPDIGIALSHSGETVWLLARASGRDCIAIAPDGDVGTCPADVPTRELRAHVDPLSVEAEDPAADLSLSLQPRSGLTTDVTLEAGHFGFDAPRAMAWCAGIAAFIDREGRLFAIPASPDDAPALSAIQHLPDIDAEALTCLPERLGAVFGVPPGPVLTLRGSGAAFLSIASVDVSVKRVSGNALRRWIGGASRHGHGGIRIEKNPSGEWTMLVGQENGTRTLRGEGTALHVDAPLAIWAAKDTLWSASADGLARIEPVGTELAPRPATLDRRGLPGDCDYDVVRTMEGGGTLIGCAADAAFSLDTGEGRSAHPVPPDRAYRSEVSAGTLHVRTASPHGVVLAIRDRRESHRAIPDLHGGQMPMDVVSTAVRDPRDGSLWTLGKAGPFRQIGARWEIESTRLMSEPDRRSGWTLGRDDRGKPCLAYRTSTGCRTSLGSRSGRRFIHRSPGVERGSGTVDIEIDIYPKGSDPLARPDALAGGRFLSETAIAAPVRETGAPLPYCIPVGIAGVAIAGTAERRVRWEERKCGNRHVAAPLPRLLDAGCRLVPRIDGEPSAHCSKIEDGGMTVLEAKEEAVQSWCVAIAETSVDLTMRCAVSPEPHAIALHRLGSNLYFIRSGHMFLIDLSARIRP